MNHPHGDTFKEVRCLANCVETYIPDPDKEEQTRTQKVFRRYCHIAIAGRYSRSYRKRRDNPKNFEPRRQKLSELMDFLDCSKDSIWLATYMVEEGVTVCPYALSVFEEYLEKCELNP